MTSTATAPPALDASAKARLRRLDDMQLPTRRDEAWRYAPHNTLAQLSLSAPNVASHEVADQLVAQMPQLDGPTVVVVNGVVDVARSNFDTISGVHISTLAAASTNTPELVAEHFSAQPDDAFGALNLAYGSDGVVVTVDDGIDFDSPVHIVNIVVPEIPQSVASAAVVIAIGQDSKATVVETHIGDSVQPGGSNMRTTVTLAANATLEHIVLQDAPSNHVCLAQVNVSQAAGSNFAGRSFNLGASYGRLGYNVHLNGDGANANLSGLYFGFGDQTLDQQINVVHAATNCTSQQSFRGVLDDSSTGIFNGGIDVLPGADGTDAEQANDNLLLSDQAEANSQPRLEILADDVACKHGSTVGQLDESALYYMRSRGLSADKARQLLIDGFAHQVVETVQLEAVRNWVTERIGHDDA